MKRGVGFVIVLMFALFSSAGAREMPVPGRIDGRVVSVRSDFLPVDFQADAHRWIGGNGVPVYGDRTPQELEREQQRRDHLVRCYQSMATTGALSRSLVGNKVVLLSARWCSVSAAIRTYLHKRKIRFREYDIEHQARGRALYAMLGTDAVPVVLVGRQYMYGFYAEGLARMLHHRYTR